MPKLSLCMIVQNEAAQLPRCLASVQGWVDEMVIADTGSTDETVALAQQAGARVLQIPWQEDFAGARNQALAAVEGEWVLVLDADEVFNSPLQATVNQAIAGDQALVVNLMRQEVGASQSPYSLVSRLFRRHPQLKFNRPYHETIDDSVLALLKQEPQWQIITLPGVAIQHYGYTPENLQAKNKAQRAKVLLTQALQDNPQDAYLCSKLGALLLQLGQEKDGLKLLKQGLKSNQGSVQVRFELHYHLANAYKRSGKWELALKHYQKAINEDILLPLKLGALNNCGSLLNQLGDYPQAQRIFEAVVKIDPTFDRGYYNLGLTLKANRNLPAAIQSYKKALELNPNFAPAHQNLGVAYFQSGLLAESLAAFKTAIALYEQQHDSNGEKLRQSLQEMGLVE